MNPKKKIWKQITQEQENILKYYREEKHNEAGFAEVQVSLSKNLDYYSATWMNSSQLSRFNQLVSQIVSLSLQMITPFQAGTYVKCGCQDGACFEGPLGNRFKPTGDLIVKNWPILPAKDAVNFEFHPDIKRLYKGCRLYRVVGANNYDTGCWWILDALPNNRTEWRSDLAVPISWNLNNYYVEFAVYEPLKVWMGIAASTRVPKEKCILKGGGVQVWIDPNDLKNISLQRKSTNWPRH